MAQQGPQIKMWCIKEYLTSKWCVGEVTTRSCVGKPCLYSIRVKAAPAPAGL